MFLTPRVRSKEPLHTPAESPLASILPCDCATPPSRADVSLRLKLPEAWLMSSATSAFPSWLITTCAAGATVASAAADRLPVCSAQTFAVYSATPSAPISIFFGTTNVTIAGCTSSAFV